MPGPTRRKEDFLDKKQIQTAKRAMRAAVRVCGSVQELCRRMHISRQRWDVMQREGIVTAHQLIPFEHATRGKIRRHMLRPDLYAGMVPLYDEDLFENVQVELKELETEGDHYVE